MTVQDRNQAIGDWISKLMLDKVSVVEYVRERRGGMNFWQMDTVAEVERHYKEFLNTIKYFKHSQSHWITVGSEEFITRIRLGIAKCEIKPSQVVFKYEDNLMFPNEYGVLDQWPVGFCDYNMDLLEDLMMTSMKIREAERERKSRVE